MQSMTHHDEYSRSNEFIVVVVIVCVCVCVCVRVRVRVCVVVAVECCCIFIINYCWQTSRASFAFSLSQMLTFHINLRSVETKRWHARLVLLLLAFVLA